MSKKVPLLGMFVAFAVILSYVESCIPVLGIPGMKILPGHDANAREP